MVGWCSVAEQLCATHSCRGVPGMNTAMAYRAQTTRSVYLSTAPRIRGYCSWEASSLVARREVDRRAVIGPQH